MRTLSIQKRSKFVKNKHARYTLVWDARYLSKKYGISNDTVPLHNKVLGLMLSHKHGSSHTHTLTAVSTFYFMLWPPQISKNKVTAISVHLWQPNLLCLSVSLWSSTSKHKVKLQTWEKSYRNIWHAKNYVGRLISFASTVIFAFTLDISG